MGLPAQLLDGGYAGLLRPVLFASHGGDAESIHEQLIGILSSVAAMPALRGLLRLIAASEGVPTSVAGVSFPNRVGLAAGMDKNGLAARAWGSLGFGFVEVGTVTAQAQPGNDRPRVFRARASHGLVNRMGFNNHGAAALASTLGKAGIRRGNNAAGIPVGISIGKTKLVAVEDAVADYLASLDAVAPYADYVAINVSSPNTPNLRTLQDGGALSELTQALVTRATTLAEPVDADPSTSSGIAGTLAEPVDADPSTSSGIAGTLAEPVEASPSTSSGIAGMPVPIFVKVAPDLSFGQLDEVLAACEASGIAGVIATNTTLGRAGLALSDLRLSDEAGGLSGAPLTARAREVVGYVTAHTNLPVIGVGGVMTAADARALFDAGAHLVQLYTGFIYHGPGLVAAINADDSRRNRG